jgi:hypothetical protein
MPFIRETLEATVAVMGTLARLLLPTTTAGPPHGSRERGRRYTCWLLVVDHHVHPARRTLRLANRCDDQPCRALQRRGCAGQRCRVHGHPQPVPLVQCRRHGSVPRARFLLG